MNLIKHLLLFLIILSFFQGKAQVNNIHNFYTQNMFYYSPAHTGDKEQLAAFANYRNHLMNIEDASQTVAVGLHAPVTTKMNIGGLLKTERLGLVETLSARLDYSFRTHLSVNQSLAFGINLGAMQRNISSDNVIVADPTIYDPTLDPGYIKKYIYFTGASMSYVYKNFEFDFGIPLLYKTAEDLNINYLSFFAYSLFSKSKKWQLKPSASINYTAGKLLGYNANLLVNYENVFWFQPTYKVNGSIAFSAGVNLKKIGFGYAYETNSGALSAIGGPSHEILISYGFFKPKKHLEDSVINDSEYKHKLKPKIGDKTYEEYVTSNNYGFYNNIIGLTDSIHKEELRKIQESKNIVNTDSVKRAELLALEKARLDSIEQAKKDSARMHNLRNVSKEEMGILEEGVHFNLGSAMLTNESREYLDKVAQLIKNNKNIKILISGHTCNIGSDEINLQYSRDRAEAVMFYLVSKGADKTKISTDLKLDAEPIVPNTSEENRQQNRRVSFLIIKE